MATNKDQLAYLGTTTVFETKDVAIPEYNQVRSDYCLGFYKCSLLFVSIITRMMDVKF